MEERSHQTSGLKHLIKNITVDPGTKQFNPANDLPILYSQKSCPVRPEYSIIKKINYKTIKFLRVMKTQKLNSDIQALLLYRR